jgi:4-amino-4-deoxy-L-arabinose transferase-like glycosyltransferase
LALPPLSRILLPVSTPQPIFAKPSARLLLLLIVLWAIIYLPGLGTPELKGEEGRRILPAITMLETGNWVVPYVGGKPFLRKPPLVNWAIAASLKLTGARNEWSARLPSVLAVLALGLAIVALGAGREWMNAETALTAALLTLTPLAMLDKGRLAEIEGIYVALTGLAIVTWLAFWTQRRSPWLLWLVPFVFIGLGGLAKAPLHLLFFYAIVLGVLGYAKEWRLLRHPAHFAGLALAGAMFAAWAIPYFYGHADETKQAAEIWQAQSMGRVTGQFDFAGWASNLPRALSDQLPWVLFAPLLWRPALPGLDRRAHAMFRGTRLGVLICFFGLLLIPGILPRYALPLVAPFACLLAFALADHRLAPPSKALLAWWRSNSILALVLAVAACASTILLAIVGRTPLAKVGAESVATPDLHIELLNVSLTSSISAAGAALFLALAVWLARRRFARPAMLAIASAMLLGSGMLIYAGSIMPLLTRHDKLRPVAAEVEKLVDPASKLCVYDPDIQPVLFYLQRPFFYAPNMEDIPAGQPWVFTREEKRKKLLRDRPEYELIRQWPEEKPQVVLLRNVRR